MKIVEVYKEYYSVIRNTLPLEKRVYLDDVVPAGRYYLAFQDNEVVGGFIVHVDSSDCIQLSGMFSLSHKRQLLSVTLEYIDKLYYMKEYIILSCIGSDLRDLYSKKGFWTDVTIKWSRALSPKEWYSIHVAYEPDIYYMRRKVGHNELGL